MQEHAAHRPARPLAAMGTAPGRRLNDARLLQVQPGRGVAELVAVPLDQLLVEVLDGEALVGFVIQPEHALELVLGRTMRRRPADPPIDQPVSAVLLVAPPPTTQGPLADPQRRGRLGMAQTALVPTLQQFLETHDPDPRQPLHPTPRSKSLGTVPEPDRSRAT